MQECHIDVTWCAGKYLNIIRECGRDVQRPLPVDVHIGKADKTLHKIYYFCQLCLATIAEWAFLWDLCQACCDHLRDSALHAIFRCSHAVGTCHEDGSQIHNLKSPNSLLLSHEISSLLCCDHVDPSRLFEFKLEEISSPATKPFSTVKLPEASRSQHIKLCCTRCSFRSMLEF